MRKLILWLGLFGASNLNAQQVPFLRSESYSPQWHNPASFGTWNKFSVNLAGQRHQLIDSESMNSYTLTAEVSSRFTQKVSVGAGLVSHLYATFFNKFGLSAVGNIQFKLRKVTVSTGLSLGAKKIHDTFNLLALPVSAEQTKMNVDAGIHVYNNRFYAGFSITQLNFAFYDQLNYVAVPHFFITSGYRFKIAREVLCFPSLVFGSTSNASIMAISARSLFKFYKPGLIAGAGYSSFGFGDVFLGYEKKWFAAQWIGSFVLKEFHWANFRQELRLSFFIRNNTDCSTCETF